MLVARILAVAMLAVFPAVPAMAKSVKSNIQVADAADASSGTTTYFGSSAQAPRSESEHEQRAEAAKPKPKPIQRPTLTATVDQASQRMVVKVDGETRYSWPVSTGVAAFPTPNGSFRAQWTSKMWYSRKYDMSPMPHAVFINGGVAVHGTYHTGSIGSPASHGCIRLSTANAKTFYNLVQKHGLSRTRVTVIGKPHWRGGSEIASRDRDRKRYADNDDNDSGFWGDSWGNDSDSAFAPSFTRKKYRDGYADRDGRRVKARQRKNGDYADRRAPRRGYYGQYGYYADGY
ncbi:MAG TPA: L,D-transpeptidase [Hyphomicrobium sp.]